MPPEDIRLETLPPEEWPTYKALRLEALQNAPQAFGSSYAESVAKPDDFWKARLESARERKENWLLFARQGEHLIGLVGAFVAVEGSRIADIVSVYVTPAARGNGIARNLLSALLDELAQNDDLETARLTVNKNQLPAVALYTRLGFTITAEEEAPMGDGNLYTEYIMEKPLRTGSSPR